MRLPLVPISFFLNLIQANLPVDKKIISFSIFFFSTYLTSLHLTCAQRNHTSACMLYAKL